MPRKVELDEEKIVDMYKDGNSIEEISVYLKSNYGTIRDRLLENKVCLRRTGPKRKISVNDSYFSYPDKENCYWAGFIAADGNVQGNQLGIILKDIDFGHLEKFKSCINLSSEIRIKPNGKYKKCSIRFRSNKVIEDLENIFSIVPNKSLILLPPNILKEDLIKAYIMGYFDGDGCISKSGCGINFEIYSGSKDILDWIKQKIQMYVNVGNPNVKCKKENTYRFSFTGRQGIRIMNWLYEDCKDNYLERKRTKYLSFLED